MDIFERELAGEVIDPQTDPEFDKFLAVQRRSYELTHKLNTLPYLGDEMKPVLKELFAEYDESTMLIPPFYTDFGKNTRIGKGCMIQQGCVFFDRGGITIGDNVQIAPKVNLVTLNHDLSAGGNRKATYCKPIVIEDNVWIGIDATILPGVTLGRNCVVAAGSVVTKDVPANVIVAGNPAKIVKRIK